jgi:hypothetical protein
MMLTGGWRDGKSQIKTCEVILKFEERYTDIRRQVCKMLSRSISGLRASTKITKKMKSVGYASGARLCH